MYISVKTKFTFTFLMAFLWLCLSFKISLPWIYDLSVYVYVTIIPAYIIVFSIALFPGFMYAFIVVSYTVDKRIPPKDLQAYPPISILIAAFNEEKSILDTLTSIKNQEYPGTTQVILIDDGSIDNTLKKAHSLKMENLHIIHGEHAGKASSLNHGLTLAKYDLIITLDADTFLLPNGVKEIVKKLYSGPSTPQTAAVAGAIYVKNSRNTLMTRIIEWDFFHAIAVIKRSQSLFQGTLVAQGAFSIYRKDKLIEIGGWQNTVGEDIVLTWGLLSKGYRIDFAENAICFSDAPETYKQFFYQRSRWARGLIEAFFTYPKILTQPRLSLFFIYWNIGVILFDMIFFFVFIPGVVAAFFGFFYIAGPMTLCLLPIGMINNLIFFIGQRKSFCKNHLHVRKNWWGFIVYFLVFQLIMSPAVIHGYFSEILRKRKLWGTK